MVAAKLHIVFPQSSEERGEYGNFTGSNAMTKIVKGRGGEHLLGKHAGSTYLVPYVWRCAFLLQNGPKFLEETQKVESS